jgi:hypothetical protein
VSVIIANHAAQTLAGPFFRIRHHDSNNQVTIDDCPNGRLGASRQAIGWTGISLADAGVYEIREQEIDQIPV